MSTTIVYLHGFRSSPASIKARRLQAFVDALPAAQRPQLHIPELTHAPAAAIRTIAAWVERHAAAGEALTFVGSSLGGFYATHLAEHFAARAVLVNPAVHPERDLAPWIGPQTNLHTGEAFEVTSEHFAELAALVVPRITRPERYFLLVEAGDEVLDYREAVVRYGGAWQYVHGGGDHTFTRFEAQIPAILRFAGLTALRVPPGSPSCNCPRAPGCGSGHAVRGAGFDDPAPCRRAGMSACRRVEAWRSCGVP